MKMKLSDFLIHSTLQVLIIVASMMAKRWHDISGEGEIEDLCQRIDGRMRKEGFLK